MLPLRLPTIVLSVLAIGACAAPTVLDTKNNVTYEGVVTNVGVEKFLNIPYGQDTGGQRRFSPPEAVVLVPNSVVNASATGPVCPQTSGSGFADQTINYDESEDCLRLKVARPAGTLAGAKLPVMVYIYGGGLYNGNINELDSEPGGLVLQSVANGLPIIYVAMNYRLNIFGFALSEVLRANNSLNVGLRDQRLALEWVQENIDYFGGDPDRVTIFGQSSGALSVTLQILAYGGSQPVPFHGAIIESTALEPTMTSNITLLTFNAVANLTGCDSGDPQSAETLQCLRDLPFETLLNITIAQVDSTSAYNDGDVYLPAVDGDFLPLAASELTRRGLFAQMPVMIGWTDDDATLFTPEDIETPTDTLNFIKLYYPVLSNSTLAALLSLYPSAEFSANPSANLSAEFYRSAQMFRDILLTCPSFYFGHAMAAKYAASNGTNSSAPASVYYYDYNQTIYTTYLADSGLPGLGVIHTSELAYVFANFTAFNLTRDIFPTASDYEQLRQTARSWSTFANLGQPSLSQHDTVSGWEPAYASGLGSGSAGVEGASLYVIGGPHAGMSTLEGSGAMDVVESQALAKRCAFLNREDVIAELQY